MNLQFVLKHPEAPGSLNAGGGGSRRHWAVAHREKKRWEEIYRVLLMLEHVPKDMAHCRVDVVIRWKRRARRDPTNYITPVIKPLADTLAPPQFLYEGKPRVAIPNPAPRWLPDDTDEFFMFGGLRFEHPRPWTNRLGVAETILTLTATYLPKATDPSREPSAAKLERPSSRGAKIPLVANFRPGSSAGGDPRMAYRSASATGVAS